MWFSSYYLQSYCVRQHLSGECMKICVLSFCIIPMIKETKKRRKWEQCAGNIWRRSSMQQAETPTGDPICVSRKESQEIFHVMVSQGSWRKRIAPLIHSLGPTSCFQADTKIWQAAVILVKVYSFLKISSGGAGGMENEKSTFRLRITQHTQQCAHTLTSHLLMKNEKRLF